MALKQCQPEVASFSQALLSLNAECHSGTETGEAGVTD